MLTLFVALIIKPAALLVTSEMLKMLLKTYVAAVMDLEKRARSEILKVGLKKVKIIY